MLRRVKKDVITEMTGKTEITVHCKLSSRQQAFYQAIKNKISLAELFDGTRGHLNEKKLINLMNIVMQLRKVEILIFIVFLFFTYVLCFQHFDKRKVNFIVHLRINALHLPLKHIKMGKVILASFISSLVSRIPQIGRPLQKHDKRSVSVPFLE